MAASIPNLRAAAAALLRSACSLASRRRRRRRRTTPQAPINLEAASSDFDYRNNTLVFRRVQDHPGRAAGRGAGGARHRPRLRELAVDTSRAQVRITVPDGKLASDSATVTFRDNQIVRAAIRGTPATFEQRLEGRPASSRRAAPSTIEYDVRNGTVRLARRRLAQRRPERDPRQHADLRHRRSSASPRTPARPSRAACASRSIRRRRRRSASRRQTAAAGAARHEPAAGRVARQELPRRARWSRTCRSRSTRARSSGLLGPNGAGKTTAFYMIVGLVPCDAGRIWLDDRDLTGLPMHRRARLGPRLPAAGSLGVPQADGRGQHPRDPRDARRTSTRTRRARRALESLLEELHIGHIRGEPRHEPVGRRAAARRDRARAGGRAALHPARRAVRRASTRSPWTTSSASSAT